METITEPSDTKKIQTQREDTQSPDFEQVSLDISEIEIYGGTQARANTNDDAIDSYAESIESGKEFPPVLVYFDGEKRWLADGFHRVLAHKRAGSTSIQAIIKKGSRKDAILHALGANSNNSLYRSNADKRNAVEIALEEFPDETNTFIAQVCAVSPSMVGNARKRLDELNKQEESASGGGDAENRVKKVSRAETNTIERQPRGENSSNKEPITEKSVFNNSEGDGEPETESLGSIDLCPTVYADNAIKFLSKIPKDDPDAAEAYRRVNNWLKLNAIEFL